MAKIEARSGDSLYIEGVGRTFRVTAIYTTVDEANEHMRQHPSDAVLACYGELVFLANMLDRGRDVTRGSIGAQGPSKPSP